MRAEPDLRWWLSGLAAFAIVVAMGAVIHGGSPFNIVDHQAAGSASNVNAIQSSWRADGLRELTIVAMAGDLIFIGIYSLGAWRAGRSFARMDAWLVKGVGWAVAIATLVFCVTDYIETGLQLVQMAQDRGSDWMAATAALMQPIKIGAWIVTFIGVAAAWLVCRLLRVTA